MFHPQKGLDRFAFDRLYAVPEEPGDSYEDLEGIDELLSEFEESGEQSPLPHHSRKNSLVSEILGEV